MANQTEPKIKIWDNIHGNELEHMKTGRKLMARFCVEHGTSEAEHLSHQDFATEVAAGRMSRFDYLHTDKDGRTIGISFSRLPARSGALKLRSLCLNIFTRTAGASNLTGLRRGFSA